MILMNIIMGEEDSEYYDDVDDDGGSYFIKTQYSLP